MLRRAECCKYVTVWDLRDSASCVCEVNRFGSILLENIFSGLIVQERTVHATYGLITSSKIKSRELRLTVAGAAMPNSVSQQLSTPEADRSLALSPHRFSYVCTPSPWFLGDPSKPIEHANMRSLWRKDAQRPVKTRLKKQKPPNNDEWLQNLIKLPSV